jgi:hypothetical protein
MMPVKCTVEVGGFSFPKDCYFLEQDRLSPIKTQVRPLLEKKEHFYHELFSESGNLST